MNRRSTTRWLTTRWLVALLGMLPTPLFADWPPLCATSPCTERLVTTNADALDGSLRDVLQHACEENGDDAIQFGFSNPIVLKNPIWIPKGCHGSIFLFGRSLKRQLIRGDAVTIEKNQEYNCLIRIEGDGHLFSRINIVGFSNPEVNLRETQTGIGLCLFGNNNVVEDSTFGVVDAGNVADGNDVGILVVGNQNQIRRNHFSQNKLDGIQVSGNQNIVAENYLGHPIENCEFGREVDSSKVPSQSEGALELKENGSLQGPLSVGGCQLLPDRPEVKQPSESTCPKVTNWRYGIHLFGGASKNRIGSLEAKEQNILQYQGQSAIRLSGNPSSQGNLLSPNIFSFNKEMAIDLGPEGVTPNDLGDSDEGPNRLLNHPVLSVVQVRNRFGNPTQRRFVLHGRAAPEQLVDIYLADSDKTDGFAEGITWLKRIQLPEHKDSFRVELTESLNVASQLVAVAIDADDNTSEFSFVLASEIDTDLDGIADKIEDVNSNGIVDAKESDPFKADTDGDGLMDSLEDQNRNGKQDRKETAAFAADTDGDGVSDFVEVRGDGLFNPENGDTDPLKLDTDCDGFLDGEEDTNANGIVEWHLGETFPQMPDSDGDGLTDGGSLECVAVSAADNCPLIPNADQRDSDGDSFGDVCDPSN